jgi:hypothetical protein
MDPLTVAKLWILVKPYKRLKNAIKARKERKLAINIGTRTSTNAVVGGGILGVVYVNLVEILPWPGLVAALTTPEMVSLVSVLLAGLVARFSKTPRNPGKL